MTSEPRRYLCGGFCGQWLPRSHFQRNRERERCFRGDDLQGQCRVCRGFLAFDGRVYLLRHVRDPDLYYVGSSVLPLASRLERHWFDAEVKQRPSPLYKAMRQLPCRDDWAMELLQDNIALEGLTHVETCWAFHLAPEGQRLPPLNKKVPTIPCPCDYDPNYGFRAYPEVATTYPTYYRWLRFSKDKTGVQLLDALETRCVTRNEQAPEEDIREFLARISADSETDCRPLLNPETATEPRPSLSAGGDTPDDVN